MTPSEIAAYLLVIVTLLAAILRELHHKRDVAILIGTVESYKKTVDQYDKHVQEFIKVVEERGMATEKAKQLDLAIAQERRAMKQEEDRAKNLREGARVFKSLTR